jgi:hypothetical protein
MRIPSVGNVEFFASVGNSLGVCLGNRPLHDVVGEYESKRQRWDRNPKNGNPLSWTLAGVFHDAYKKPNRADQTRRQVAPEKDSIDRNQHHGIYKTWLSG